MASSIETFSKLATWKKSHTLLKLTLEVNGVVSGPFVGFVTGTDKDLFLVHFSERDSRDVFPLDLDGALFRVGKRSLDAEKSNGDWLAFEETE